MHVTLRQLRVFETVARRGGFTRAAEELHLAQPTVSVQVKQLADAVGLPLFEQVGRKIFLTDAGRQLYATCRQLFEVWSRFEMSLADLKGLNRRSPWYAFVMLLMMFSLAGIPPTMGFYAKLVVLQALLGNGLTSGMVWLAVLAVAFSLIGAFYYVRVVKTMYFEEPVDSRPLVAAPDMQIALSVNGLAVIVLGIAPQYLLALCANAMIRTLTS